MSIYSSEYQKNIVQSWHTFVRNGTDLSSVNESCVRNVIYESWIRSRQYHVNPFEVKSSILSPAEIQKRIIQKKSLIEAAHSYMLNLYSFVKGSNFVVILTDEHGYIIEMIGDDDIIQARIKNSNLVLGSNRSEQYAGTNAIGTCLSIGSPIQVWGEEHYVKAHHPFTCSAAPICDQSGAIIGCLDITGPREKIHHHTLGMVVAAVDGIEKEMKMRKAYEDISIINNQLASTIQSISSGIIMIDNLGIITQFNNHAAKMLRLHPKELMGANLCNIIDWENCPIDLFSASKNIYDKEIHLTNLHREHIHLSLSISIIHNNMGTKIGSVIILNEIQHIHKLVNKLSGFSAKYTFDSIIGNSQSVKEVKKLGRIAAGSSSNVLILGESGTGKELIAQSIHNASSRSRGPFIAINCGSLPKGLIESELFGYEGGAFTGANKDGHPGKFELADGGTIFLDEIGDMPLDLQASLLRVLQTKEIVRIGGKKAKQIDVRIMAATNNNLEESILSNSFRSDLYYRLNVFSIYVPPLRDRKEDIPILSEYFIDCCNSTLGKKIKGISEEAMKLLLAYNWPGNVRELENVIERAVNLAQIDIIMPCDLPYNISGGISEKNHFYPVQNKPLKDLDTQTPVNSTGGVSSIKDFEYNAIFEALSKTAGNMRKAADILGIGRRTLYRKIEKYNIDVNQFR